MDSGESKELIISIFRKYKWAAAVMLAGILLMALPQVDSEKPSVQTVEEEKTVSLEQQLESILTAMEGAGCVRVLLTEAEGEEQYFQTDQEERQSGDSQDRQRETVIINAQDRSQQGLVRRTDPPVYRGAVVLCQGADSARVRLAVVEAVSTATGLRSDKISVLKMK